MITIALPFPVKLLWPNGRPPHWAAKHRAIKAARKLAWQETRVALGPHEPDWQKVNLAWVVHPKTAHHIDDDAPPAALKAFRDGIADALGIDDAHFTATYTIGAPVRGGAIEVSLSEAVQPSQIDGAQP